MTWTMDEAAKELQRGKHRPLIKIQLVARGSGGADGEIAPVWATEPAQGALVFGME